MNNAFALRPKDKREGGAMYSVNAEEIHEWDFEKCNRNSSSEVA